MAASVFVPTASGGGGASSTFGAAFPSSGSAAGAKDGSGNMQALNVDGSGNLLIAGTLTTTPPAAGTCTTTSVAANAASVTVLAANASRLGFTLYNDSTSSCNLKRGITASTSSFHKRLLPNESYATADLGYNYTGRFDCIWDTGTGNMRIGEDTT